MVAKPIWQPLMRSPPSPRRMRDHRSWLPAIGLFILGLLFVGAVIFAFRSENRDVILSDKSRAASEDFLCENLQVVDGDTIRCQSERVRLVGIDAPEMPGHCRAGRVCTPGDPFRSKERLQELTAEGAITCRREGQDRYGRTLARCSAPTGDISCAMVASGMAILRYSQIECDRAW